MWSPGQSAHAWSLFTGGDEIEYVNKEMFFCRKKKCYWRWEIIAYGSRNLFFLLKVHGFLFPDEFIMDSPVIHRKNDFLPLSLIWNKNKNPGWVVYVEMLEGQKTRAIVLFQLVLISHTLHDTVATTILWWSSMPGKVESQTNLRRPCLWNAVLWQVLWLPLVAIVLNYSPDWITVQIDGPEMSGSLDTYLSI